MLNENFFILKNNLRLFKEKLLKKISKKKKVVAVIQVRMESKRLPGKAMLELGGKPCLQHVIERVKLSEYIDKIIIATTTKEADKKILHFVYDNFENILVFQGSPNDVYGRVLEAARITNADIIVDITADCPLIDPEIIDENIEYVLHKNKDYSSNVIVRSYADGMDVQVYTRKLMEKGNTIIVNEINRENAGYNIIKYMYQFQENLNFGMTMVKDKFAWPKLRLTLDTKDDYRLLKKIFNNFKFGLNDNDTYVTYKEVIDFILENPKLIKKKNLNI